MYMRTSTASVVTVTLWICALESSRVTKLLEEISYS